ncbi:DUF982 domain-containing protein [Mesorhizobium sp. IMUNJ 23232]|uniref:DUF982 domain-containing protein n=1 Tax=Mesorhizobium sp. IMUNJ 23232 TaxID=3376064 RepID=UPI003793B41E
MDAILFRVPLRLNIDGTPVEIDSLQNAVTFLRDWPGARRGPVYACAMKSCEAALAGAVRAEDARKAFESFARITGILGARTFAPDPAAAARVPSSLVAAHH